MLSYFFNDDCSLDIAITQFPPTQHFPSDPKLAYESFFKVAAQTGNESAQAYLAFFYATGYHNVVPVDQAKAQLYFTFAANGGDRGAEMALGYRYWSGIGVSESCQNANFWYRRAAEKGLHACHIHQHINILFMTYSQLWPDFCPDPQVVERSHRLLPDFRI